MELNKNSFSAKLYRWFYDVYFMPINLCPYFWKLVFMWIAIIPYVILTLPGQIVNGFSSQSFYDAIGKSIVCYLLLFILIVYSIVPINFFMGLDNDKYHELILSSQVIWFITLLYGALYLIILLVKLISSNRTIYYFYDEDKGYFYINQNGERVYRKKKKINIIYEFIKAKYNKYCPQIKWKDKND